MKTKLAIIILAITSCLAGHVSAGETLKVYLPRDVQVNDASMVLGDVAIIRGSAEDIKKASAIAVGKFSMPGQQIKLDRKTIQSRLVANNFKQRDISFSGSDSINIGRKEMVITSSEIVAKAAEFLGEFNSNATIGSYELTRKPKSIAMLDQSAEITFVPRINVKTSKTQVVVDVDVLVGGVKIASRQIGYRPIYLSRQVIAASDVAVGAMITSENIRIEQVESRMPEAANWKSPVGLIARINIRKDRVIRVSALAKAKPEILIKRNTLVVINIRTSVLDISASGLALGEGGFGELIKVKNIDSKKIIICKVNFDGTVSPVI